MDINCSTKNYLLFNYYQKQEYINKQAQAYKEIQIILIYIYTCRYYKSIFTCLILKHFVNN